MAASEYVRVITFDGISESRASAAVYDRDDMFFAPFGGSERRTSSPNVAIFERRLR